MSRNDIKRVISDRQSLLARFEALVHPRRQNSATFTIPVVAAAGDTLTDWANTGTWPDPMANEVSLNDALARSGLSDFGFDSADEESLRGAMNLLRGVAGELVVAERLAHGEISGPVGSNDFSLLGFHDPGADLHFSVDGAVRAANVKISNSAGLIVEHFKQHSEVPVVFASSDAARAAADAGLTVVPASEPFEWPTDGHIVVDIGIESDDLNQSLLSQLDDSGVSIGLLDSAPWFTLAALVWNAARGVSRGESGRTVARRAATDSVAGGVALTAGRLFDAAGATDPISAVGVLLSSAVWRSAVGLRTSWAEAASGDLAIAIRAEGLADPPST